jgi:hypothetical protein
MPRIYQPLRTVLTWFVGVVLAALIGEFAIDLAREHGLFDHPTAQVEVAMSLLVTAREQFWFWPALTGLAGLVIGMWLNLFVRQKESGSAATAERNQGQSIDYAHGLALQQIQPSLDLGNAVDTLEIRLVLKNAADGPLKFTIEHFDVEMFGNVTRVAGTTAVIPKDGNLTIFPNKGFSKTQYIGFKSRGVGRIEYSILYGHPDKAPSRRAYKLLHLDLFKKRQGFSLNWIVQNETDEPAT